MLYGIKCTNSHTKKEVMLLLILHPSYLSCCFGPKILLLRFGNKLMFIKKKKEKELKSVTSDNFALERACFEKNLNMFTLLILC